MPGDERASDRAILLEVVCDELCLLAGGTPLEPIDVPVVVLSEVMRDVVLVVAAAGAED